MSSAGHVDTLYHKTAKGHEAIATRSHGLVGRMRSLLILVDGKRPQGALQALAMGLGDIPSMLAELQANGFITSGDAPAAPAAAPAPVPAVQTAPPAPGLAAAPLPASTARPPPAATLTLPQAKTFATRQLMQILGPTSETLCLRIESARDRAEFVIAVQRAYGVVADIRGRAQAELFGALIEANLPPG